jgi:stage III sporulation protein SpoIIIAA
MEDLKRKPLLSNLVEKEIFKRYVFLDGEGGPGHVRGIESFQDGREKKIC